MANESHTRRKPLHDHDARCLDEHGEWSGSPNYEGDPDNEWVCDVCENVILPDGSVKEG